MKYYHEKYQILEELEPEVSSSPPIQLGGISANRSTAFTPVDDLPTYEEATSAPENANKEITLDSRKGFL